jgi:hypothetical protein
VRYLNDGSFEINALPRFTPEASMRSLTRTLVLVASGLLSTVPGVAAQVAQEAVDLDVVRAIREEGLERSQIEYLAGYLTDVIGPRLTGSPAMFEANDWTAEKLGEWGLQNVVVEPWGQFGRGWDNLSFSGRIVEPYVQILNALPVAWTASTKGTAKGAATIVAADSTADLEQYKGTLKGKFVLTQRPQEMEPEFDPRPLRQSLEDLFAAAPPVRERDDQARRRRMAQWRRRGAMRDSINQFLKGERVAGVLYPSSRTYGMLRVFGMNSARNPENEVSGPALVISHEQYGQIWRNIERGIPVKLEVEIKNQFYDDDLMAYNTLGDIPATDLADEYVMLGGHLDSWYPGTGATDNAAGVIVMMEAVRILKALDLRPRRRQRYRPNPRDLGSGQRSRNPGLRTDSLAVHRPRRRSRQAREHRGHRPSGVRRGRDPRIQLHPRSDRVLNANAPHVCRQVRAIGDRRPEAGGSGRGSHRVPSGNARRDDATQAARGRNGNELTAIGSHPFGRRDCRV